MTITDFLLWLANSGGSILCVSWLLEQWGWYQAQSITNKRNLFFAVSLLVTMLAYSVLTYVPDNVLSAIAPYFSIVYVTFTTIYLGTAFHKQTKL